MKKYFIFFIFVIVLSSFSHAVKPLTEIQFPSSTEPTLNIVYPKITEYKLGDTIDLHFHLFLSNASKISNTTANCTLHLYNDTGNHIVVQYPVYYSTALGEWEYKLNTTYTGKSSEIGYIIECYNKAPKEYGFVSGTFNIGNNYIDGTLFLGIMLVPLIFGFMLLYASNILGQEHVFFKLFLFTISILSPIISYQLAINITQRYLINSEVINEAMSSQVVIYAWLFAIYLFYFVIIYMKYLVEKLRLNKEKKYGLN